MLFAKMKFSRKFPDLQNQTGKFSYQTGKLSYHAAVSRHKGTDQTVQMDNLVCVPLLQAHYSTLDDLLSIQKISII